MRSALRLNPRTPTITKNNGGALPMQLWTRAGIRSKRVQTVRL